MASRFEAKLENLSFFGRHGGKKRCFFSYESCIKRKSSISVDLSVAERLPFSGLKWRKLPFFGSFLRGENTAKFDIFLSVNNAIYADFELVKKAFWRSISHHHFLIDTVHMDGFFVASSTILGTTHGSFTLKISGG